MNEEVRILCFQHCQKHAKVFCLELPSICNFCGANLQNTELRIPPFIVPSPFRSARNMSNCIVIKPTEGDFLRHYKNSSALHIGVTDSHGIVYEYDVDGISVSRGHEWTECLAITVMKCPDAKWKNYWDFTIKETLKQTIWTSENYEEETHNCYTFVLVFLKSLQLPKLTPFLINKTKFCEQFIIPHTRAAAKYITLFRELQSNGLKVQM